MDIHNFQSLGPNYVMSSRGFSVRRLEKNVLVYERSEKTLRIEVEPGPTLAVYLTQSAKRSLLTDADITSIRKDIEAALHFMGVASEMS